MLNTFILFSNYSNETITRNNTTSIPVISTRSLSNYNHGLIFQPCSSQKSGGVCLQQIDRSWSSPTPQAAYQSSVRNAAGTRRSNSSWCNDFHIERSSTPLKLIRLDETWRSIEKLYYYYFLIIHMILVGTKKNHHASHQQVTGLIGFWWRTIYAFCLTSCPAWISPHRLYIGPCGNH